MPKLLEQNYPCFLEVYDAYPYFIQRCDAIRYFLLYHYGGFYIDIDIEFLKPIDDLLEDYELIFSKLVGFNNAIMGSIPQDPIWTKVFEELDKRKSGRREKINPFILFGNSENYVCYSTGSILLNDCLVAEKYHEKSTVCLCPGYIFEPDLPMEINGEIVKWKDKRNSYSIHHMTGRWLLAYSKFISLIFDIYANIYWKISGLFF
ncbi:glycosyltransferase family 32 protein [Nostoc sp. 'Peltigera membranacea cyanobiont' 232]|uniref:glycosyltransferase family 32 protein n=1 Tax=Nostoc sp. 'Peltigera membranacea cyanobiont' 232 TaxID=2014531 RepID=UPI000B953DA7|nr:glycosyltransferase [Nostoc sp. 'Peltigera membranacea cyanobiont' 232]OYE04339.1 hypothetical protein CDG79_13745 [Nostoc sp. 'Peltigera membranacea cyanobiont' 232]